MYPCIETTIDCFVEDYQFRLWINQDKLPENHAAEVELIPRLKVLGGLDMNDAIEKIIKIVPNLNAVQVKRGSIGTVVYTKAFSEGEDVHG